MNRIKVRAIAVFMTFMLLLSACSPRAQENYSDYSRFGNSIFGTFDTVIQVMAYTTSRQEFNEYFSLIQERYEELHRIYDIYNNYPDLNNAKTVNDQAGIAPVQVPQELIDLVNFSIDWYEKTEGQTNIALRPVVEIWHGYLMRADADPTFAELPPMSFLEEAAQYTDIHMIQVDEDAGTIYLPDPNMRIDIGATAKGYATELIAEEVKAAGLESFLINAGGNVRVAGRPFDKDRETWTVGLHNPETSRLSTGNSLLGTVAVANTSVVSTGDYQGSYSVDGQPVHHIIDPITLMPGNYYRAITVISEDSGVADFYSTELFLLPFEKSLAMVEGIDGMEAIWVMPDGETRMTEGLEGITNIYN